MMEDLHDSLNTMAGRGTPIGSEVLRRRVALDLAGSRVVSEPRQGWRVPGPVLAAIAGVVAVVAFGGVRWLLGGNGGTPSSTVPVATTAPAPTTIPPAPPDLAWTQFRDEDAFQWTWMNAVDVGGPGLVAVGATDGLCGGQQSDAAAWISADGTSWERVDSDSFVGAPNQNGCDGNQHMLDVVAGPAGLIAVGTWEDGADRDYDAAVWVSEDGREWSRLPHDEAVFGGDGVQVMRAVTVWEYGVVAVGESGALESGGSPEPAVWVSPDGRSWSRVDPAMIGGGDPATMADLTVVGSRLVAVGSAGEEVTLPAVWVSGDGTFWERIPDDTVSDGEGPVVEVGDLEPGTSLGMTAVAAGPGGVVAVGTSGTGVASVGVVWWSEDGLAWRRVGELRDPENPNFEVALGVVAWLGDTPVVIGDVNPVANSMWPASIATAWASQDDGATWHRVAATRLDVGGAALFRAWVHHTVTSDVLATPDGLIVVGHEAVGWGEIDVGPFSHAMVLVGTWSD